MSDRGGDEHETTIEEREEAGREAQEHQSPPPLGPSVPGYRGIVSKTQRGDSCCRDVGKGEDSQEAQYVGEAEKRNRARERGAVQELGMGRDLVSPPRGRSSTSPT